MGDLVHIFYVTGLKMQKALRTAQLENCRDSHHNYLPDGSLGQALRSAYFSMLLRHLKIYILVMHDLNLSPMNH